MDPVTEEVRSRADIVEVVSQYVALKPAGSGNWKACCPFHDEKTPSFNVSQERGFYKCFGCGVAGDVFKFLQQIENLSFPEARRQLAERYGVTIPAFGREITPQQQEVYDERDRLRTITTAAATYFREQFAGNAGLAARDYARSRGLTASLLDKFGIGYAPDTWDSLLRHLVNRHGCKPEEAARAGLLSNRESADGAIHYYDRFRHRLMFPIWDEQGRAVAFGARALEGAQTGSTEAKYLNSPEGTLWNKSRTLYGWHLARQEVGRQGAILVTEGYMDTIALHAHGFSNTIATLGTALTTEHVAMLRRLAPGQVYLCYDSDGAGVKAALRAGPLFAANQLDVRIVSLPAGEDPDTFVRRHGESGMRQALRESRLLAQYQLEKIVEQHDLHDLGGRKEAMRAAAEVVVAVHSDTERAAYIAWLAEQWARAEGINTGDRLQIVEAAVRREVEAARRRLAAGANAPVVTRASTAQGEVDETMQEGASGKVSGVTRAERALLATLLGNPACRKEALLLAPPPLWTDPVYRAIVAVLSAPLEAEAKPPTAAEVIEQVPEDAANLVMELMVAPEAQAAPSDAVLRDWIDRLLGYHARHQEQQMLALVKGRIENGETVSAEEKAAFLASLQATRRAAPAEAAL